MARRYWKKMREEAAKNPAPARADDENPWHEAHPTLRALAQDRPDDQARAEAYTDWAARMRDKQDRRRAADAGEETTGAGAHWSTDALFAESRQVERDEAGTRHNPWRVRELLAVLDLREGATRDEIGSAYRRLAKQHHPDRFVEADEETQEFHADRMRAIIEAYRALRATAES